MLISSLFSSVELTLIRHLPHASSISWLLLTLSYLTSKFLPLSPYYTEDLISIIVISFYDRALHSQSSSLNKVVKKVVLIFRII